MLKGKINRRFFAFFEKAQISIDAAYKRTHNIREVGLTTSINNTASTFSKMTKT